MSLILSLTGFTIILPVLAVILWSFVSPSKPRNSKPAPTLEERFRKLEIDTDIMDFEVNNVVYSRDHSPAVWWKDKNWSLVTLRDMYENGIYPTIPDWAWKGLDGPEPGDEESGRVLRPGDFYERFGVRWTADRPVSLTALKKAILDSDGVGPIILGDGTTISRVAPIQDKEGQGRLLCPGDERYTASSYIPSEDTLRAVRARWREGQSGQPQILPAYDEVKPGPGEAGDIEAAIEWAKWQLKAGHITKNEARGRLASIWADTAASHGLISALAASRIHESSTKEGKQGGCDSRGDCTGSRPI